MVARRQPLRAAGLLLRLLTDSPDPSAPALHAELHGLFRGWCEDFTRALALHWVPVHIQAELQTRTVLAAAGCAVRGGR
ncbi:Hydroxylacyl-CoA dehydrogenase OS=Streptomyces tendae OX=1932 GN=GUR47_15420 PE=3 SV=1 [Streptomyces tendae]